MRYACLLPLLVFNITLKALTNSIKQDELITSIRIGKEEKANLFFQNIIDYLENVRESKNKVTEEGKRT